MVVLGQQPATITDMIMCQCLASHDKVLSDKETYIVRVYLHATLILRDPKKKERGWETKIYILVSGRM